jgi:hypothetical protein
MGTWAQFGAAPRFLSNVAQRAACTDRFILFSNEQEPEIGDRVRRATSRRCWPTTRATRASIHDVTMLRAVLIVAFGTGAVQAPRDSPIAMNRLTVPASQLPGDCALSQRQRLKVDGNRWIGRDTPVLANLRHEMEGTPAFPDAVPLAKGAAARYLLKWAKGIEEGYLATYEWDPMQIEVHALRFDADADRPLTKPNSGMTRIDLESVVVFIYGPDNPCRRAVESHIRLLSRP